jgi:hypothetical protein
MTGLKWCTSWVAGQLNSSSVIFLAKYYRFFIAWQHFRAYDVSNISGAKCFEMKSGEFMDSNPHFTSAQVVQITGITPRQLQWWDEQNIVVPARSGRNRSYTQEDLAELAVMSELRRKGFSLQQLRKVVRFLQREFGRRLYEKASSGAQYHLLAGGRRFFLRTSADEVVDLLKGSLQPIQAICLSDAVTRVRSQAEAVGGRKRASLSAFAEQGELWTDKRAS